VFESFDEAQIKHKILELKLIKNRTVLVSSFFCF